LCQTEFDQSHITKHYREGHVQFTTELTERYNDYHNIETFKIFILIIILNAVNHRNTFILVFANKNTDIREDFNNGYRFNTKNVVSLSSSINDKDNHNNSNNNHNLLIAFVRIPLDDGFRYHSNNNLLSNFTNNDNKSNNNINILSNIHKNNDNHTFSLFYVTSNIFHFRIDNNNTIRNSFNDSIHNHNILLNNNIIIKIIFILIFILLTLL